ncbi:hypothetical protein BDZ88DRAFT_118659 [Geranomyces variabilis]|nr:hypothetical protein BDZ88DRAFT_118659 [Geranomyces variabilis]
MPKRQSSRSSSRGSSVKKTRICTPLSPYALENLHCPSYWMKTNHKQWSAKAFADACIGTAPLEDWDFRRVCRYLKSDLRVLKNGLAIKAHQDMVAILTEDISEKNSAHKALKTYVKSNTFQTKLKDARSRANAVAGGVSAMTVVEAFRFESSQKEILADAGRLVDTVAESPAGPEIALSVRLHILPGPTRLQLLTVLLYVGWSKLLPIAMTPKAKEWRTSQKKPKTSLKKLMNGGMTLLTKNFRRLMRRCRVLLRGL